MTRWRIALGLATSLFVASCGDDQSPTQDVRGVPLAERAEPGSVDPVVEANRNAHAARDDDDDDDDEDTSPIAPPVITERSAAPVRVRDFSHELRTAFGDPSRCLASLPATTTQVRVTVSGTVFEDGVVSAPTVSSSVADASVTQCLRSMASGLRIEGDVPDAPRVLSATLVVQR